MLTVSAAEAAVEAAEATNVAELMAGTAVYVAHGGRAVRGVATESRLGMGVTFDGQSGPTWEWNHLVTTSEAEAEKRAAEQRAERSAAQEERQRAKALRAAAPGRQWHTSPDGTPCCCTAEDRRYGCGCR